MTVPDQPPKKDLWDRVAIVSPLITGILVAAVGGVFTGVYSCREGKRLASESQQEDARRRYEIEVSKANQQHQNRILEMEAAERFFPHLTGGDRVRQRAAVVTIGKLASPEIATEIARLFDTPGTREGADVVNASVSSGTAVPVRVAQPSPPVAGPAPDRWVYLGEYVVAEGAWKKTYLEIGERDAPETLKGHVLRIRAATGALNVRNRPLGDIVDGLRPGVQVQILEVQNFAQLGYMWARVSYQ
jgi:hypothetical protein